MKRYLPLITTCVILLPLLVSGLTVMWIPTSEIEGLVQRTLQRQGYSVRNEHFGKAFPLGIEAHGVEIADSRGVLLRLDSLSARIRLLPLCVGKVVINYRAEIGKGFVEGKFTPQRDSQFSLKLDDVQLQDVPFFETVAGARIRGELHSRADFRGRDRNYNGELRLWINRAVLNGVKVGGMPLPDAAYEAVQGVFTVNGGKGRLESLTLEGSGIYMRLKGEIPLISPGSAPLNLTLELMPKPQFLERQKLVFLLLNKYLTTPGHYLIPIRGTLGRPAIQ